ncbi:MAG: cupin domain-containing protein [Candidatus Pacebacteria bacterium]|nr:cupin domain-containing protein [Candidatus Paceibacterota bacterium]
MKISSPGFVSFAIIDPAKKMGEEGQYTKYTVSETDDIDTHIGEARRNNFEIRYHYVDIRNNEGGTVPMKLIRTEIPPRYVQPFHIHKNCYELTVVEQGEVSYLEDDLLEREDIERIQKISRILREGDMVFDNEGKRHTVANISDAYVRVLTVQTPKPYTQDFIPDWQQ